VKEKSARFASCFLLLASACGENRSGAPAASATPSSSAISSSAGSVSATPPFGFLAKPVEGETVKPGDWAFGWALADSGIAQVTMIGDSGASSPVSMNQAFPGVAQSYPKYAGADKAGFFFPIPKLDSGIHTLTVTFIGKDGGRTEIRRSVRVP
jgi:hypothetical protein